MGSENQNKKINQTEIKEDVSENKNKENFKEGTKLKDNSEDNNNKENKDNRTLSEKIEDKMDDVMGAVQDAVYGPGDNFSEDIPATMERSSGIRKVNKVQTRRNFNKRVFGKKAVKIFFTILCIGIAIFVVTELLAKLLAS